MVRSGDLAGETQLRVDGVRNDDRVAIPYHTMNAEYGFIGCLRSGSGCWKREVAEVLVYADALSDADRHAVEKYLLNKYGIEKDR